MTDLLIKGLSLPKKDENIMIVIESNGEVWKRIDTTAYFCTGYKAIELPPHGDLKDADELLASDAINWGEEAWNGIKKAPTIVEASYD